MKTFQTLCLAITLSPLGCQLVPETREYNTPELTIQYITQETDAYRGTTTIEGPRQYFDTSLNSGTFVGLRTFIEGGVFATQAYAQLCCEWGFYDSAYWEGGEKAELQKIDSRVQGSAALETFGVLVPVEMLKTAAANDAGLKFKVYGKRAEKEIIVPAPYVVGYQRFLAERQARNAK